MSVPITLLAGRSKCQVGLNSPCFSSSTNINLSPKMIRCYLNRDQKAAGFCLKFQVRSGSLGRDGTSRTGASFHAINSFRVQVSGSQTALLDSREQNLLVTSQGPWLPNGTAFGKTGHDELGVNGNGNVVADGPIIHGTDVQIEREFLWLDFCDTNRA